MQARAVPLALRLAAHRSVGGGPCPASRRHRRGALALAVLLTLVPVACGGGDEPGEKAARGACQGLTKEDLRPDVDRLDFLREKEQLAAQAANSNSRYDALYDARRDLRQYTEDRDSKAALAAGLRVIKECQEVNAG
jgi:hypothetical protein